MHQFPLKDIYFRYKIWKVNFKRQKLYNPPDNAVKSVHRFSSVYSLHFTVRFAGWQFATEYYWGQIHLENALEFHG